MKNIKRMLQKITGNSAEELMAEAKAETSSEIGKEPTNVIFFNNFFWRPHHTSAD